MEMLWGFDLSPYHLAALQVVAESHHCRPLQSPQLSRGNPSYVNGGQEVKKQKGKMGLRNRRKRQGVINGREGRNELMDQRKCE